MDGVGGCIDLSEFDAGDLGVGESGFEGECFDGKVLPGPEPSEVPSQLQTECILAFHRCSPKVEGGARVFKSIHALF